MDASSISESEGRDTLAPLLVSALGWLFVANLVGVLVALLLLVPGLGVVLGPLGFGRWMPLHHGWQLYGWCSLPLVAALLRGFGLHAGSARAGILVVVLLWNASLAALGVIVLGGGSTGILFLDFSGLSLALWVAALVALWLVLATTGAAHAPPMPGWARIGILVALLPVPIAFLVVAGPGAGPPINPHSGGATGHNLLASTLGLLVCFAPLPRMLGLQTLPGRHPVRFLSGALAVGIASWLIVRHGDASHRDLGQIAALGSLLVAIPGLGLFLLGHEWNESSRPWVRDAVVWWTLLVLTGWLEFLPGVLERGKFTQALVAHAHLAMAGFLSSLLVAIAASLASPKLRLALGARRARLHWQAGTACMVVILMALGAREHAAAWNTFRPDLVTRIAWLARLACGAVLAAVSWTWFSAAFRSLLPTKLPTTAPSTHEVATSLSR